VTYVISNFIQNQLSDINSRYVYYLLFEIQGSPTTPPHKLSHTFKFKDYAPVAFAYLRRLFGVNEFDFLLSVCGNANFIEFISNAKSGQFFFYSSDGKYMIKTMTNSESKFLRRSEYPSLFKIETCQCALHWSLSRKHFGLTAFFYPLLSLSTAPLFSSLHGESKYIIDEILWNVSCQTIPPSTKCQVHYYEFSLLH
jgi:hypothetical protein